MRSFQRVAYRRLFFVLTAGLVAAAATLLALAATQTDLIGPVGSEVFGRRVVVLPNGNIVVTDPYYDAPGPITDTGAVYLYNGATGALISQLTGSQANDQVSDGGVVTLTNGNYVVLSPDWDNGATTDAGAVMWGSGTTGITGVVSITNSLVGSTAGDRVGANGVIALSNGNYVVSSLKWDNGAVENVGAVTWGNGTTGITGAVSITNSLVGSTTNDGVGYDGITPLRNGNYVVISPYWNNGPAMDAGAVTWGNGTTGITGAVSITNSLVGNAAYAGVGYSGDVTELSNGNYVVRSPIWDNGMVENVGAVTWGNGTTGITGAVSITNSLVGSMTGDEVGYDGGVAVLSNGNYVVGSPHWDNGATMDAGAATWGNGTTGITGAVSITNSLVGSSYDWVGRRIRPLSNGNYVVSSYEWDNGAVTNAGAATWGNGTTGITGVVSITNSLVGNTADDWVGDVTALSNGNYVVLSPHWDNSLAVDAGAVTWGNGTTGITGAVSVTNSLVGSTAGDEVGIITALSNGNYVVFSSDWDNGAVTSAGAATWGNGTTGITGVVSITNSLVGSTAGDIVGAYVTALSNGNYVVYSSGWDNGAVENVGAVTWGNGTTGITGVISVTNSLVGSTTDDRVGGGLVTTLNNGNYVVLSFGWDNGAVENVGAVTWGNGTTGITGVVSVTNSLVGNITEDVIGNYGIFALNNGNYVVLSALWDDGAVANVGSVTLGDGRGGTVGPITADNSVRGSAAGGGQYLNFEYDYIHNQLVVGRPVDNIVTLFRTTNYSVYLPLVRR